FLLTSVVFAWVHYPSLPLMIFTFFMELLFLFAFFKWKNLWPLGLFHGWIASFLLFIVLDRDLWIELWSVF
ncbi:MAG: CPBP family glutamic-type intramembrane protease, partial [Mariniphaga sp.]